MFSGYHDEFLSFLNKRLQAFSQLFNFFLEKFIYNSYSVRMVVLSGELAVPCSRNPLMRGRILSLGSNLKLPNASIGRRATDGREPRQIRKEAAISDSGCVADRSRSKSGRRLQSGSNRECTAIFFDNHSWFSLNIISYFLFHTLTLNYIVLFFFQT